MGDVVEVGGTNGEGLAGLVQVGVDEGCVNQATGVRLGGVEAGIVRPGTLRHGSRDQQAVSSNVSCQTERGLFPQAQLTISTVEVDIHVCLLERAVDNLPLANTVHNSSFGSKLSHGFSNAPSLLETLPVLTRVHIEGRQRALASGRQAGHPLHWRRQEHHPKHKCNLSRHHDILPHLPQQALSLEDHQYQLLSPR